MNAIRCLGMLSMLAVSMHAQAGTPLFDNVRVAPNPAFSGQPVALLVNWGGCGAGGQTTTSIAGSVITVTEVTGEQTCGVPPPAADVLYPLGAFSPGSYTARYIVDPGTAQQITTDVPFAVTGAANANALPANHALALAGLALALLLLARRKVLRRPVSR
jgi:hypothetical protein